ncbi:HAMP domain-containing histidine kinase [Halomonas eurihalina]|uniref:histidine kinase n=1 Tax=Halomonas eurihalina TaxID=42566 RepID=A0A5D9DD95_HALER|nr:HAMP domain-containing sensor histidine kinase [Halomonas eurihalina]MDR5858018.1 HAMP domain-containing sensor histidine kinase [Halomonas eurihalina]TZG41473.1 HAMP domain-containing histidine kinase [Halomonas eurihalina]
MSRRWRDSLARASVATRLLLGALLLIGLLLPLAGLGLAHHFRDSVTTVFDERLESLLNVVIAGVRFDEVEQRLVHERTLDDPRFRQVFSGWYWQVSDGDSQILTSRSLWDQRLPLEDGPSPHDLVGPRDTPLRIVSRDIRIAPLATPLRVSVAAPSHVIDLEASRFNRLLGLSLAAIGLLVLLGLAVQIRWGLAPLRRLRNDLRAVENGDAERLGTQLPAELARLAGAMNAVLERDRRRLERARHAAGNLAHALKTPVSVLTTLADGFPEDSRRRLKGELTRIDDAVRHHLARASAAGDGPLNRPIRCLDTLQPVLEGLTRLAERRGLRLEHDLPESLTMRLDPQDLQEVVGNLLDNALRWAEQRVRLSGGTDARGAWLLVEDDGPGMSEADCQAALARGAKLDEQRSGSGLGLAIVNDLVTLHDGSLTLERADLGGLSARVWLPDRPW